MVSRTEWVRNDDQTAHDTDAQYLSSLPQEKSSILACVDVSLTLSAKLYPCVNLPSSRCRECRK
jgi:hypothetical protein